jgi:hypothetical protein
VEGGNTVGTSFSRRLFKILVAGSLVAAASSAGVSAALADDHEGSGQPAFGPNVYVFSPSTPQSEIQARVDAVASQQVSNQFGTQRYALLFKPGTYGSKANPLSFQLGYYTAVAGLGLSPNDVVINGSIDVYNQCAGTFCTALNNFWRSMSNLTINVTKPAGCREREFWAVSQAAPMRRVQVNGQSTLMDYCTGPSYASGGFIADSGFSGLVVNGSQQQWMTRNSTLGGPWTNAVWNQVFSGVVGAPTQSFPNPTYTTLPASPVTREAPFLYVDSRGNYNVFVPAVRRNSAGTTWGSGPAAGSSIPLERFFVAHASDSARTINRQLARGKNLLLTPGIYHLDRSIQVGREGSVVIGLGFPTLIPQDGSVSMKVANGVVLSGMIFDAGPENSPVLLQVGTPNDEHGDNNSSASARSANEDGGGPVAATSLHDIFFRIGGATPGRATTSLVVNSDNTILDNIWAWRADHGNGVGWTSNTADTGVVVNGDNVIAYGLFVEHYQKYEVIWNGNGGTDIFFQNEMPYDPPSQAAWMEAPGVNGWAAFKVAGGVDRFAGYGMGSYSFFNKGVNIYAAHAFEVPTTLPASSLRDLLTIFLDATNGSGGILHVVNDTGGSSTKANPDVPVTVTAYP